MNQIVGWKRFLIGGLGGLAPVAALLLAIDFEKHFADPMSAKVLGYAARVVVLFAIGGVVAWLHENEDKLFKLFEIGVGAPALIAGFVTTNSLVMGVPPSLPVAGVAEAIVLSLLPSAHAQGGSGSSAKTAPQPPASLRARQADSDRIVLPEQMPETIKKFKAPTTGAQFLEGFIGVAPTHSWYVIAGSHATQEDAAKQAAAINAMNKELKAEVFAPVSSGKPFGVVLGAELSRGEAKALRNKAISAGIGEDAHIRAAPGR